MRDFMLRNYYVRVLEGPKGSVFLVLFFCISIVLVSSLCVASDATAPVNGPVVESSENCQQTEALFQSHLVGRLDHVKVEFSRSYECFAGTLLPLPAQKYCEAFRKKTIAEVLRNRELWRKHRTNLTKEYLKKLPDQEYIQFCLGPLEKLKMAEHSRTFQVRSGLDGLDRAGCENRLRGIYGEEFFSEFSDLEDPDYKGLSEDEKRELKDFKKSPLGKALGDSITESDSVNGRELNIAIGSAFLKLKGQSEFLQSHIAKMSSGGLYRIYAFDEEFKNFRKQLSSALTDQAQHCYDTSYFLRECGNMSLSTCFFRSVVRPVDAVTDIVPIVSALKLTMTDDMEVNQASFAAGLKSLQNYNREQFEFLAQAAASFPNISAWALKGGVKLAAPVSRRAANSISSSIRASIARNSYRDADYFFDTNVTSSLFKSKAGMNADAGDDFVFTKLAEYFSETPESFSKRSDILDRFGMSSTLRDEIPDSIKTLLPRTTSPRVQIDDELKAILERFKIGQRKGTMDRQIISELFEISRLKNKPVTFFTADRRFANGLCRLAKLCTLKSGNAFEYAETGFDIHYKGATIHVVPVPGK